MLTDLSPLALNALERALCAAERDRAREVTVSTETLRALVDAKTAGEVNEELQDEIDGLLDEIDDLQEEVSSLESTIEDLENELDDD